MLGNYEVGFVVGLEIICRGNFLHSEHLKKKFSTENIYKYQNTEDQTKRGIISTTAIFL